MRVIAETYKRDRQGHLHKKRRFVLPYDLGEYRSLNKDDMELFISRHLNIGSVMLHASCDRRYESHDEINPRTYFFWCNAVTVETSFFLGISENCFFEVGIHFDHESEEEMTTLNYCDNDSESVVDLIYKHGHTAIYDAYLAGQADSYLFGLLAFYEWKKDAKGRFIAPSDDSEVWEAEEFKENQTYPSSWFRFDLVDSIQARAFKVYCGIYQQAPDGRKLTKQEYAAICQ